MAVCKHALLCWTSIYHIKSESWQGFEYPSVETHFFLLIHGNLSPLSTWFLWKKMVAHCSLDYNFNVHDINL